MVLFALLATGLAFQSSRGQQKLDEILVHGDDFLFGVKEPAGWKGDATSAEKFGANVVLHEADQPQEDTVGLIRISVNDKVDENTQADLEEDKRSYKKLYSNVLFKELAVRHATYSCLASVFYVPGKFYEYVAYVNPGPRKSKLFSVSMNTGPSGASPKQAEAFQFAIRSLNLLKP
jgi:hypothetical protein